jgi:putative ABC transport system ATP-binding protein
MIIKTEGLTKLFRTEDVETMALDEVDLIVEKGEFTSIMGPSGCGKSTLLHILGLIDNPDGGHVPRQHLWNRYSTGLKESFCSS